MKQLVCLSHTPWQSMPSRTQQLMTRMRGVEVLFFEPPASGKHRRTQERRVRSNLTVYARPGLGADADRASFLFSRGQAKAVSGILKVMERHRFSAPLLWLTSPEDLFVADALPCRGLVYDCSREWDELPLEWESELAARADVVFAASPGLVDRLAPCCDNIALIPNGVNTVIFAQARPEKPPALRRLRGPVFCRVGLVDTGLDLEPLCYAAVRRPRWNFVLLGPASPEAEDALRPYPNIFPLGQVPAAEVPDYLAAAHVCFDLLSRRNRGSDILPPHTYEYLASGRPIVEMLDEEQVEPYPDVVYTAHTPGEFLIRCEHALREDPSWVSSRRREYAARAGWSGRAEEVRHILETAGLL